MSSDDRINMRLDDGRWLDAELVPGGARARVDGGEWHRAPTLTRALRAVGAPSGTELILQGMKRAREAIERSRR